MPQTIKITLKYKAFFAVLAAAVTALVLLTSLTAPIAQASGVISVTSNVADVPGGANFILTVRAKNDGDVNQLEIDHSAGTLPEFSVYADETDPYGGDGALFATAGVTVTYDATTSEWVIDFGNAVTQSILTNYNGEITFYFVLRDAAHNILWGHMNPVTPENTFGFNLLAGTGDSLVPQQQNDDDDVTDAVIPRVPNTSIVR